MSQKEAQKDLRAEKSKIGSCALAYFPVLTYSHSRRALAGHMIAEGSPIRASDRSAFDWDSTNRSVYIFRSKEHYTVQHARPSIRT